jgi:hypothetical protein
MIDEFPLEFKFFEEEGLEINHKDTQAVTLFLFKKIRHLIVYMLHEDHAMN